MKPILVDLSFGGGGPGLHTYGVALAVGLALGMFLAARQARDWNIDHNVFHDTAFWMLVASIVGARVLYIALNFSDYASRCSGSGVPRDAWSTLVDCTAALRAWEGGLVFYGGGLAGVAAMAVQARRHRLSFAKVADLFGPSLALGHAFGRMGCFAAGCCFGKACPPHWPGAAFPPGSIAYDELSRRGLVAAGAAATPRLHPTQLYEALGVLLLFAFLTWYRRRQRRFGATALLYVVGYAALRSAVELFRGDAARRFLVEISAPGLAQALGLPKGAPMFLSTSQLISLVLACLALGWLALPRLRQRVAPTASDQGPSR